MTKLRIFFEIIRYVLLFFGIIWLIELYYDGRPHNRNDYLFSAFINLFNVIYYLYIRK